MKQEMDWLCAERDLAAKELQSSLQRLRDSACAPGALERIVHLHPAVSIGAATAAGFAAMQWISGPRSSAESASASARSPSMLGRMRGALWLAGSLARLGSELESDRHEDCSSTSSCPS
jgi:hypothetical protein